jgi:hypothetical protein
MERKENEYNEAQQALPGRSIWSGVWKSLDGHSSTEIERTLGGNFILRHKSDGRETVSLITSAKAWKIVGALDYLEREGLIAGGAASDRPGLKMATTAS